MDTLTVKWTDFTVLKKHDVDRDKPYLWVFGIVIDGDTVISHDYVIRKPSSSASLGNKKFKKAESVTVPSDLDISRQIKPFLGMETAGVVVLAWENATTRDSVITRAYADAADAINEFVTDVVAGALAEIAGGTPLDEIDVELTDGEIAALQADLATTIRATIRAGSNLWQAIPDHNIGSAHAIVNLAEPVTECFDFHFVSGSTHYDLEGDLSYGFPTPKPGREPTAPPPKHQEPKPRSIR